jgi:hypothetical protein
MNERIQELAEQAGIFRPKEFYQHIDALQLEKFAELIVQECMGIADLPNNASGQWDHLLPSEVIGKHFGVEE